MNIRFYLFICVLFFSSLTNLNAQLLKRIKNAVSKEAKIVEKEIDGTINQIEKKVDKKDNQPSQKKYFEDSKIIKISSPEQDFRDIYVQAHNGLVRVGVIDEYKEEIYDKKTGEKLPSFGYKFNLRGYNPTNYPGFFRLMETKTYSNLYSTMKAENFYNLYDKDEDNSMNAYLQTKMFDATVCLNSFNNYLKYNCFNNQCKEKSQLQSANIGLKVTWNGSTNFEQMRTMQSCKEKLLPKLIDWSKETFQENYIDAYYVKEKTLSEYDFENKGFWIRLDEANNRVSYTKDINFYEIPNSKINQKPKLVRYGFLFKQDLEKGEKLYNTVSKNNRQIYLVEKVRLKIADDRPIDMNPNKNYSTSDVKHLYTLEYIGDEIEIFLDKKLESKYASVKYSSVELK